MAVPTIGRKSWRSTKVSVPDGETSSSLAASSEFAVGELILAITVGEPISV